MARDLHRLAAVRLAMSRRTKKQNGYHAQRNLGSENCAACGTEHHIVANTWVMLASGSLVCANDSCWRVMANWYKEKDDAKRMDKSSPRSAEQGNESALGREEGSQEKGEAES